MANWSFTNMDEAASITSTWQSVVETTKRTYFFLGMEAAAILCKNKTQTILDCTGHKDYDQMPEHEQGELYALRDLRDTIHTVTDGWKEPDFVKKNLPPWFVET